MSEIYRTFKARRIRRRNLGIVLAVLGLLLMVACFRMRFRGALWVGLGGGLALEVIGWMLLVSAYGPPTREVLVLASERRAAITPADLVAEMDLDVDNARAILEEMRADGLLRRADNVEAYLLAGDAPRPQTK